MADSAAKFSETYDNLKSKAAEESKAFYKHNIFRDNDLHDLPQKVAVLTTQSALLGGYVSFYEVLLFSKPPSWLMGVARAGQVIVPVAATGFLYASAVGITAKIRNKNDHLNHGVAGMVAGSVRGMYFGAYKGIRLGMLLALVGMVFKDFGLSDRSLLNYDLRMHHKALPFEGGTFFVNRDSSDGTAN